jgi:multidrug efflux pump subunit AcrA (membrane-fusion protein)
VAGLTSAPVNVAITTASVSNALVVPVTALLSQPQGGYAVEAAGAGNARHLVAVTPGLFDDADGLVSVTGPGLAAGQRVVVPAT